jgi:hypothetical protein
MLASECSSVNDSIHRRRYSKMLRIEPDMGVAADHTERPEIKLQAAQAYRMASATMMRLVHRRCAIGDPAAVEC